MAEAGTLNHDFGVKKRPNRKIIFGTFIYALWSYQNQDAKIYVGRSTTVHNLLLMLHTLCMSNVTKTFLLVSSSVSSKQLLCFVHGQGQKREQKHRTKNFVEFHNHSPLLTMFDQSRYKLKPQSMKTDNGDPLFLLHFFDFFDVDNHLAKFQIKSIATSISGE